MTLFAFYNVLVYGFFNAFESLCACSTCEFICIYVSADESARACVCVCGECVRVFASAYDFVSALSA